MNKNLLLKCSSANLVNDSRARGGVQLPGITDDCWLFVITAPPAHTSLLSQQMMAICALLVKHTLLDLF